jgi:hypothetical protein
MLLYSVSFQVSLNSSYQVVALELRRYDIFWEINLDQTVGIHRNNLDWKGLRICVNKRGLQTIFFPCKNIQ